MLETTLYEILDSIKAGDDGRHCTIQVGSRHISGYVNTAEPMFGILRLDDDDETAHFIDIAAIVSVHAAFEPQVG
jgi:hypothetical protein